MKEKIIFDPAISSEGDNIGAFLKDSAGNLLSSTLVSGKQSLDINVVQSALPAGAATEASLLLVAQESTLATRASEATLASILSDTADIEIATEAAAASLAQFQFSSGKLLVESADAVPNTAIKSSNVSVSNSATLLVASSLANRKLVKIQNAGSRDAAFGTNTVTFASGFRLSPGSYMELELGPSVSLYGITGTGSTDVRVLEVA
jgi:hypothetical protein